MLDEFSSDDAADYIAGFRRIPHRGFENVTYMLDGHMRHEDHLGHAASSPPAACNGQTAGTRHHPLGDAAAGSRPDARLPAVDQLARREKMIPAH